MTSKGLQALAPIPALLNVKQLHDLLTWRATSEYIAYEKKICAPVCHLWGVQLTETSVKYEALHWIYWKFAV